MMYDTSLPGLSEIGEWTFKFSCKNITISDDEVSGSPFLFQVGVNVDMDKDTALWFKMRASVLL